MFGELSFVDLCCPLYFEFHALLSTSSYTFAVNSNVRPTSMSSSMGMHSLSTEPEVSVEDKSTKSKKLQEKSQQTELKDNLKDFHMLLENISKSLDKMEEVFKSASSSSNATTESLADIKSFFNMSVDVVLLNGALFVGCTAPCSSPHVLVLAH